MGNHHNLLYFLWWERLRNDIKKKKEKQLCHGLEGGVFPPVLCRHLRVRRNFCKGNKEGCWGSEGLGLSASLIASLQCSLGFPYDTMGFLTMCCLNKELSGWARTTLKSGLCLFHIMTTKEVPESLPLPSYKTSTSNSLTHL